MKEKHVDMYIQDAFALFNQAKEDPEVTININILNSMLYLHTQALRVEELDANVLPLYDKFKIKHDIYTYQHLSKMYLNLADYDMVVNMYLRLKKERIRPNQMYLNTVLDASMRTDKSDIVYDVLKDFLDIKRKPHVGYLHNLNKIKHMPDRLYVLLKENFAISGQMTKNIRQHEKPKFREDADKLTATPKTHTGKRLKPKKAASNQGLGTKIRKSLNVVL